MVISWDDGIGAEAKHDSFLKLTILGNTFGGAGNHYIEHMSYDDAFAKVTVGQNSFNSADNDTMHVEAHDSSFTKPVADGNTLHYQSGYNTRVTGRFVFLSVRGRCRI